MSQESSIVPAGQKLINVRNDQPALTSMQIEVGHVISFFVIIFFIVGYKIWAKPKTIKREMVEPTKHEFRVTTEKKIA
jgi:hypothetical protein